MLNISIQPIDGTPTGTTTLGENRPWSDGNEEILKLQDWSLPIRCSLVLYPGHKWFQVLLSNANNLIQHFHLFAWLNCFKHCCVIMIVPFNNNLFVQI